MQMRHQNCQLVRENALRKVIVKKSNAEMSPVHSSLSCVRYLQRAGNIVPMKKTHTYTWTKL